MKIDLTIPQKLSLNEIYAGLHYRVRKQHKDLYREHIWAFVNGKYEGQFPVVITYTFHFSARALDSSNLAYMVKLIEDGLVHNEVLPDDDPRYVVETVMRVGEKANEDSVNISIEPVVQ